VSGSWWLSALAVALLVYGGICVLLFLSQRSFIYYPTPATANAFGEDLRIASGGETLQVWRLNPGQPQAILYFGGNAEDVAANSPAFAQIFPDYTVYLTNYRGYGASTGAPTEANLFADAEAIYDHIKPAHERIHAIGRSLGSGVAIHLASARKLDRLALVTPFDSIASVAAGAMPLFPVKWLLRDRFDSAARAGKLSVQMLVLIAEADQVIPRPHSERLLAALPQAATASEVIMGADHNSIGAVAAYWRRLRNFITATD
jgi:hypothetical protein